MPENNIETLNAEIAEFNAKYKGVGRELEDEKFLGWYLEAADAILSKYPNLEGEARERLGKFCQHIGCWTVVFGQDLEQGIPYYHKALELCPDSYDIHFEYFTTLEEIIPNEKYSTPELVQDAIDCLTFCIDACDTLELKRKRRIDLRYIDLANTYRVAGQEEKARECEKMSAEIAVELAEWEEELAKQKKKPNFFMRLIMRILEPILRKFDDR